MTTTTDTTTDTTSAQAPDGPTTDLHLLSVLESGLPAQLGTAHQPARYTVPAVFSRQVSPLERARIEDPETARLLSAQVGRSSEEDGSALHLAVSDRRLLIENTTLEELRDGLAAGLAAMLRELGTEQRAASSERLVEAEARADEERQRAAATHAVVASIRFA